MLRDMSPLNKRIIDLETQKQPSDNYGKATLTNRASSVALEENNHVQLSSKLHSKAKSG